MSRRKKRWYVARREFRKDIELFCLEQPIFVVTIVKTYNAAQYFRHITKIWHLSRKHKDFQKEYNNKLWGQVLSGGNGLLHALHFCNKALWEKWVRKIPEDYAMAEAYGAALRIINQGAASDG